MKQILDLHIHSSFSRACSPKLSLSNIERACEIKGVDIIASGDFTHPAWFTLLKNNLEESFLKSGLYYLKDSLNKKIKFILSTEISLIYKEGDKTRKVHLVVHAPNLKLAEKLNKKLAKRFNLNSDGRPILGISAPEFIRLVLDLDPYFIIYPAHIWTPWFSVLGSKSGFDSLEGCFKDELKHIYAIETGLSSDPEMIARLSQLDKFSILSSSDAHSLNSIGREATVMNLEESPTYQQIYQAICNKKKKSKIKILYTIEFYSEEGKYYLDGHRACNFSSQPTDSKKLKNLCPVCGKELTIGVLNRVESLADRHKNEAKKIAKPFKKLIELDKIIAEAMAIKNRQTKTVRLIYDNLINSYGPELSILLDLDLKTIGPEINPKIISGIDKIRRNQVQFVAGFDGFYGQLKVF